MQKGGMGVGSVTKTGIVNRPYLPEKIKNDTAAKGGKAVNQTDTPPVTNQDSVDLSTDWKEMEDIKKAVNETIEALKKEYSNISIITGGSLDAAGLVQTAVNLGKGNHLILSQEFIDRMCSSEEEFIDCKEILIEILDQLNEGDKVSKASGAYVEEGQATFWMVPEEQSNSIMDQYKQQQEMINKMNESLKSSKKQKDYRYTVNPASYNPAGVYASLAKASTKAGIQKVMGDAHRAMGSLRLISCLGDDEDRMKARAAMRSYQKLLFRGRQKMNRLSREEILEVRRKRAQKNMEEKKEAQIRAELKKRRTSRHTADGAIRLEGRLDSYGILWRRRNEYEKEYEAIVGTGTVPEAGISTGGGIEAGGSFTAEQVTVFSPVSF